MTVKDLSISRNPGLFFVFNFSLAYVSVITPSFFWFVLRVLFPLIIFHYFRAHTLLDKNYATVINLFSTCFSTNAFEFKSNILLYTFYIFPLGNFSFWLKCILQIFLIVHQSVASDWFLFTWIFPSFLKYIFGWV